MQGTRHGAFQREDRISSPNSDLRKRTANVRKSGQPPAKHREIRHEFAPRNGIKQGLPPIVGSEGGSVWFGNCGHIEVPPLDLPVQGFSILVDLQSDRDGEQTILYDKDSDNVINLTINHDKEVSYLRLHVGNGSGATFDLRSELSAGRAHRLLRSVRLLEGAAHVVELEPWSATPGAPRPAEIGTNGVFTRIGSQSGVWSIGGFGDSEGGAFCGRVAQVAMTPSFLTDDRICELINATDNPNGLSHDKVSRPSDELIALVTGDIQRLRAWANTRMTLNDMREASSLIARWFFEGGSTPVLIHLCQRLGVQLWLAGTTDAEQAYSKRIGQDENSP